ncbi:hypothetical protein BDY24DRAFT_241064 [Mrakia frigida]|uniref:uncharacterized protein n=1 Tax=Mrakia frigida TaxID=29902 RepID=UPI003FCC0D8F
MEGVVEIAGPTKSSVAAAAAVGGSRVPRRSYVPVPRPLEEKFAPNPSTTTTARSRDSCVFDLNTPTKSAFSSIAPTSIRRGGPGTPSRLASKSMGNLAAAAKADRAREDFDPRRDSSANRASVGSPGEAKTLGRIGGTTTTRRPSPILAHNPPPSTTKTSSSSSSSHHHNPFLGGDRHQPLPPSRTERTFARPPLPSSIHSMPVNLPTSSSSTTLSSDRPLFPNTPARYDHNDVENLPSPFLRRPEAATGAPPPSYNTAPTLRSSARTSMPRSRSTVGLVAGAGGGNLARMAMGNAAERNVRGEVGGGAVKERPTMLQRVSRASGLERTGSRDSFGGRERGAVGAGGEQVQA